MTIYLRKPTTENAIEEYRQGKTPPPAKTAALAHLVEVGLWAIRAGLEPAYQAQLPERDDDSS